MIISKTVKSTMIGIYRLDLIFVYKFELANDVAEKLISIAIQSNWSTALRMLNVKLYRRKL